MAWSFITPEKSCAGSTDESGFTQVAAQVSILSIPLPELFDTNEWTKLKEWNQKINSRIHDANFPKTSNGKYFVMIPHSDYNEKTIGVRGTFLLQESKLKVKDEFSGSSSSEYSQVYIICSIITL